jgi:phosphatidate phosphatase APP1
MTQPVCSDRLIGSLRLRSYAGRSLFSGLMSAPAARKRAGLAEVMDSFSDSYFILIGDSGEQDLELYVQYVDLIFVLGY